MCIYEYNLITVCQWASVSILFGKFVQLVVFCDDVHVAKAATGLPYLASHGSCA